MLRPSGRMNPAENFLPGSRQHLLDRLRRLSWLSQEQIRDIADASQMLEIKRGGNIYGQGDSAGMVYIILAGMAVLSMNDNGLRVLVGVVGPGDIVGISAMLATGGPRPFRCEALSECKVAALGAATFRSLMMSEPATFEKAMQATFGRG